MFLLDHTRETANRLVEVLARFKRTQAEEVFSIEWNSILLFDGVDGIAVSAGTKIIRGAKGRNKYSIRL